MKYKKQRLIQYLYNTVLHKKKILHMIYNCIIRSVPEMGPLKLPSRVTTSALLELFKQANVTFVIFLKI